MQLKIKTLFGYLQLLGSLTEPLIFLEFCVLCLSEDIHYPSDWNHELSVLPLPFVKHFALSGVFSLHRLPKLQHVVDLEHTRGELSFLPNAGVNSLL